MAGDEIVVQFAALNQAASDISTALSSMQSELDGVNQQVQPLLSSWQSDAQEAFAQRKAEWESAANDLHQLLNGIKGAVLKAAEIMQAREQANVAKFSR
ncbi:WXG100 family type VII secretion target [Dactylosporangium sp. NPDC049140]|jgi:WXG100 family type VII secretion target|uniref:WXG100 family type VII secretion target n=1 Tax=unclassified Dactylosporangium TaxID=2621675 RepID=UPI0033EBE0F5